MALTPQQLQALMMQEMRGSGSWFADATPGMDQNERNQWINQYGTGGTNWGDTLDWGKANAAAINGQPAWAQSGGTWGSGTTPGTGTPSGPGRDLGGGIGTPPVGGGREAGSYDVNSPLNTGTTTGGTSPVTSLSGLTMPSSGSGPSTGWSWGGTNAFGGQATPNTPLRPTPTPAGGGRQIIHPAINSVGPGGYPSGNPTPKPIGATIGGGSTPPGSTGTAKPYGAYSWGTYKNPWGRTTWR